MVQKSGKLTSWGKGSWNPMIYDGFLYIQTVVWQPMTSPQRRQASGPSSPPKVPAGGCVMEGVQKKMLPKQKFTIFKLNRFKRSIWIFVFFLSLWIRHPAFRNNFFGHAAFLEGVHQMSVNIGCIGSPKPRSLSQLWKDFCWKTLHRTFRSALPQTNSLHLKKCIVGIQVSCLGGQFSGASFRCLFGMNTNLSHVLF